MSVIPGFFFFMTRNIRLTIQYDGTNYFGWQKQPGTKKTIQETIEKVLRVLLREKIELFGAGRTDSGVHAARQVANFKTTNAITLKKLQHGLNALLPDDVRIVSAANAPADFHSRFSASEKTYRYTILNSQYHDVFMKGHVYHFSLVKLDIAAMRAAGKLLVGKHDFSSFKVSGSARGRSNVRTISKVVITKKGSLLYIDVTGEGFLYKMVRGIAGTLIEIGRGRLPVSTITNILDAKNRTHAGPTAPACGLCLQKIKY